MTGPSRTTWVLGDQLNRRIGALAAADPDSTRVLLVESEGILGARRWHRQRLHLVLTAMRRFARELESAGFEVDLRRASSLAEGVRAHVRDHGPAQLSVTEPNSWDGTRLVERLADELGPGCEVEVVRSDQFLCHRDDFAAWADERGAKRLRMEDFYRWQRRRLGVLLDGDEPVGGRWNHDADNREPPPKGSDEELAAHWPSPVRSSLDDLDREVLADIDRWAADGLVEVFGADPDGWWATSRRAALARLRHFVDEVLPGFGPHEDAMVSANWHLAHSVLSPAINIGLLLPGEVADAAEEAYRAGGVPVSSAEGFVRQVIGWREYVWGVYWRWMPDYRSQNVLGATRDLPPALLGAPTRMACLEVAVGAVEERGWAHHIQRLMVLANLGMLAGVDPWALTRWMWGSFVDGAEWVMLPNVIGMGTFSDGGRMSTKPYAAGGAYINRMSDHCRRCEYDPKRRTGDTACPYTTLYWDFLARHRSTFQGNHRLAQPLRGLDRLSDLPAVRARAAEVLDRLDAGDL